jgi:hypothetical protein
MLVRKINKKYENWSQHWKDNNKSPKISSCISILITLTSEEQLFIILSWSLQNKVIFPFGIKSVTLHSLPILRYILFSNKILSSYWVQNVLLLCQYCSSRPQCRFCISTFSLCSKSKLNFALYMNELAIVNLLQIYVIISLKWVTIGLIIMSYHWIIIEVIIEVIIRSYH